MPQYKQTPLFNTVPNASAVGHARQEDFDSCHAGGHPVEHRVISESRPGTCQLMTKALACHSHASTGSNMHFVNARSSTQAQGALLSLEPDHGSASNWTDWPSLCSGQLIVTTRTILLQAMSPSPHLQQHGGRIASDGGAQPRQAFRGGHNTQELLLGASWHLHDGTPAQLLPPPSGGQAGQQQTAAPTSADGNAEDATEEGRHQDRGGGRQRPVEVANGSMRPTHR